MSDTPAGPGWWKASDDKWYPPEQHPDYVAPPAPENPPAAPAAPPSPDVPQAPAVPPAPEVPQAASSVPPSPPVEPTPAAPAGAPPESKGGGSTKVIVGIVAVIALIGAAFVVVTQLTGDEAGAETVSLEAIGSQGSDPFFASFAPEPAGSLRQFADSGAPGADADDESDPTGDPTGEEDGSEPDPGDGDGDGGGDGGETQEVGYQTPDGSVPGLYGGTLDEAACDLDQLSGLLDSEADKAAAWAEVLEIDPSDIGSYIADLTPVNLGSDTRVVNHGFSDGSATPRESILQRGTAVLIDPYGVPRVNCYSGAPLRDPVEISTTETYEGDEWDSFEPTEVAVVEEAPSEQDSFELTDVATGDRFSRAAGSRGDQDGASRPAEEERTVDGEIEFDRSYDDRLEDDRREALYTFDAPEGAVITLRIDNNDTSVRRVFWSLTSEGDSFGSGRVNPGAEDEIEFILDHQGAAPFELSFGEGPAAYTFELELAVQDDAGQGGDAGDDFASAFDIESGDGVEGRIGGQDSADMYLLELQPGTELQFELEVLRESERRPYVTVLVDGETVYSGRTPPGASDSVRELVGSEDGGTLEITVSEGPALYNFDIELVEQQDGGQPGDAGGALADAREVPVGEELSGQVGQRDEADYFTFAHPGTDGVVHIDVADTSPRRVRVELQGADGSSVGSVRVNPGAVDELTFPADQLDSVYRLIVTEGRADYTIVIESVAVDGE